MTAPTARQLDNDDEQRQREHDVWQTGYQLGHADGWQAGHDAAHNEMAADWRRLALTIRRSAIGLYNELERLRRTPGGAIYHAARARRGGHEYHGGPVDEWPPARPEGA